MPQARKLRAPILLLSLLLLAAGCDSGQGIRKGSDKPTISLRGKNEATTITAPAEGKQLLLALEASDHWRLEVDGKHFVDVSPALGGAGEHTLIATIKPNEGAERKVRLVATLVIGDARSSLEIIQQGKKKNDDPEDPSSILGEEIIRGDVTLIELPRLSGKASDYFITHRTNNSTQVTYSMEYNVEAHHSRWVCFSFDEVTKQIRTKRSEAWGWDPLIPSKYEVFRSDFERNTFARGHLVASYDRVYSREANVQTFYYSNMSPQRHAFNEGIWQQMERFVQDLGRGLRAGDILYVAKGGTIRPDQIEKRKSNNKIVVPKYYWIALLKHEGDQWSAMALLAEHLKPEKAPRLLPYAISIAELEEFTGLDFFFNLPDEIEKKVERLSPQATLAKWPGL